MAAETFSVGHLSGSTSGRGVLITATTSATQTVHTAVAGATDFEDITMWCHNPTAASRSLTIEVGGTGNGDILVFSIGAKETVRVMNGRRLNGGVVIQAFSDSASQIALFGKITSFTAGT